MLYGADRHKIIGVTSMSILSDLGQLIGELHHSLVLLMNNNRQRMTVIEREIEDLKLKTDLMQITGSVHRNDIRILGAEKGVILESDDYTQYRLRITSDKKLIIDDVTNDVQHVNEIQLTSVDSENDQIGEMTIGEDFEIG